MDPVFEFPIILPRHGSRGLLRELHAQLRGAILDGRLRPGLRLPSTRALATACGVSRNTAVAAYDLLIGEGYVEARRGSGAYVAATLPQARPRSRIAEARVRDRCLNPFWRAASLPSDPSGIASRQAFRLGVPDDDLFPFDIWRRLSARALRTLSKGASGYAEAQGRPALRTAIAGHVSFARAVACAPDDVVVTAGAQQAFDLLARVLVTPGRTVVAVEDPGYPPLRVALQAVGAKLAPVRVDAEGIDVERLPSAARVICVTPSHQFPLGVAMSPRRRAELLAFARARDAVIVEDDYDGEFRFGGRPLDALQTLDRDGAVFYVGTFSKSLFPALRLGYVVAPAWARAALVAAKQAADMQCATAAQDTLAAFIAEGHLARHVRRMRHLYAARREVLLEGLRRDFAPWLQPLPAVAGLHLTALAARGCDVDGVLEHAVQHDLALSSLRMFHAGRAARRGIVFGYGATDERGIVAGLARLRRLLPP